MFGRRRARRQQQALAAIAFEQGDLVRTLIDERTELIRQREAPPLPDGILARIEGGWVAMDLAADEFR